MTDKELHDFHQTASKQGQHRNGHEMFSEYYARVMATKKARDKKVEVWRRDTSL